jgi:hypothetical protein
MANTYTVSTETVMGNMRVQVGTLTMTDGSGGDAVDTGMNQVIFAADNSTTQAHISHTTGSILATTAASGAALDVIVFGQ